MLSDIKVVVSSPVNRPLLTLLIVMLEFVDDSASIPLDQIDDPSKQDRGSFVYLCQVLA